MSETCFYIECLKAELERRKSQNEKYSLRLYAKDLGLDPSTLSSVMRGLRPFPWRRAKAVAQRLNIDSDNFKRFIQSIHSEVADVDIEHGSSHSKVLDLQQYSRMIEEWEYYPLMTYFESVNPSSNLSFISKKFGISVERVAFVVEDLIQLGFLKKDADGTINRATDPVKTPEDIPSSSLRAAHVAEMDLAKQKMQELGPFLRDISSITFAGDAKKMAQAKKLIRTFRLKLSRIMQAEDATEVYQLSIQLVPLTNSDVKENGR